jgi:hypothetical protein
MSDEEWHRAAQEEWRDFMNDQRAAMSELTHDWNWLTGYCEDCGVAGIDFVNDPAPCPKAKPRIADDFTVIRRRMVEIRQS